MKKVKNIIKIKNKIREIANEQGADSVIVTFLGLAEHKARHSNNGTDTIIVSTITVTDATGLEVYKGDSLYDVLPVRIVGTSASATLPKEVFTGSILHVRLVCPNGFSQFYHIVYNPEYDFVFKQYDEVVCGNLLLDGTSTVVNGEFNTYDDLAAFNNSYLRQYDYSELRSESL